MVSEIKTGGFDISCFGLRELKMEVYRLFVNVKGIF